MEPEGFQVQLPDTGIISQISISLALFAILALIIPAFLWNREFQHAQKGDSKFQVFIHDHPYATGYLIVLPLISAFVLISIFGGLYPGYFISPLEGISMVAFFSIMALLIGRDIKGKLSLYGTHVE